MYGKVKRLFKNSICIFGVSMIKKKIKKIKPGKSEGLKNFLDFFKNETNQKVIGFILSYSHIFFHFIYSSFFSGRKIFR